MHLFISSFLFCTFSKLFITITHTYIFIKPISNIVMSLFARFIIIVLL